MMSPEVSGGLHSLHTSSDHSIFTRLSESEYMEPLQHTCKSDCRLDNHSLIPGRAGHEVFLSTTVYKQALQPVHG
jgi:hypothetical protein